MLALTQFSASDNIRNSAAGALPALIKCAKAAAPENIAAIHEMAKGYSNNIIDAMQTETETDCLICQAQALKEIVDEAGQNLLQPASVDQFAKQIFDFITQSENRIQDNNKYEKENMDGDEDDQLDEEDLLVLKEENKNENQLQLDLGEILGVLFKTHKEHVRNVVQELVTNKLPQLAKLESKQKKKFMLFVLDDMVEYLGPDFLGALYPSIVEQICGHASSKFAAIRQAAVYGIGMVAQHGGAAFQALSQGCLLSIKTAIEFPMDGGIKEKKSKQSQYYHARDNAIAALGKVLQFQQANCSMEELVPFWLAQLPLTHDMEEAHTQNAYLATAVLKEPTVILGAQYERLEQFVVILGEICTKKQSEPATLEKLSVIIANISQDANLGAQFQSLCTSKLSEENRGRVTEVWQKCNDEVREKVFASIA